MQRVLALSIVIALSACNSAEVVDAGHADSGGSVMDASMIDAYAPAGYLAAYPLTAQFPESGSFDSTDSVFYVGSLGDGSVHRVDATTGAETVLFAGEETGTWWTLGMHVDVARRRLWVCAMDDQSETSSDDPPYDGYIWIFDLETGERIRNHALSAAFENATCCDVTVTNEGVGYVVDRESPNVYRLEEAGPPTLFASDDLLSAALVGQNAVVVVPDQSALLSVTYLPSRMMRIDLASAAVTEVDIDGDFLDGTPLLSGADGMTQDGNDVLVAFTSQVVRVSPTLSNWSAATARSIDVPDGMTDIIATPGGFYLLNGQSTRFVLSSETDPFALVRFESTTL